GRGPDGAGRARLARARADRLPRGEGGGRVSDGARGRGSPRDDPAAGRRGRSERVKHTLVARVLDEPGGLNRVASLFRRRAFNIDSLTVGHSEVPHVSRMTIVVDTQRTTASLVAENLRKLVPVLDVQDVTHRRVVSRDLALIRVRCEPGERSQMADLVAIFRGRIVDVGPESVIVEVTGDEDKVDGLVDLLRERGIVEMVRTGKVALVRGTKADLDARASDPDTELEKRTNGGGAQPTA